MAELGSRKIEEALAALASPREPAAAGVASAFTAAAAAALVELAAALAANKIAAQDRNVGDGRGQDARRWRSRPASFGGACWTPATRMRVPTLRSPRPGEGREQARALDRASEPPLAIAEAAAAVAERAAEVAEAGDWAFTADAVVAGELAAAAAHGCAHLVETNLAGDPADPRPARARAAADLAAQASRTAAEHMAR